MQREPSHGEGLRTPSASDTEDLQNGASRVVADRPTVLRASLGWALVVLGILVGFGVGSRIGSAEDTGHPSASRAANHAQSEARVTGREALAQEVMSAIAERGKPALVVSAGPRDGENAAAPDAAAEQIAQALVETAVAGDASEYALASVGRPVPIDKLPIYQDEFEGDSFEGDAASSELLANPSDLASPSRVSSDALTIVTRGKLKAGASLGSSMKRQGIKPGTVHLIAQEMRKVFDFRNSRPGDTYRLGQDADGRVLDFRYSQSEEESYYLSWNGTRYTARKEEAELRPQIAKIAGIVDSSFYGAVLALGEQSALAADFARILAWDIDFSRSVHPGDEFQILYERLYRRSDEGEEVYVRPGRILAGRYDGRNGEHTIVYFEGEDGRGAYFRPDGTSIERAFLAAPLEFSRITSRFTWARKHPILKITRPHPGIDYAAAHGTPVYSVAEGVVEYKARAGASGNLVRIRHQGGLTSHYAHLASFAKNLKVGDRVNQRQVIGYVGSTGLSTGPHVCFRVKRDGRYVDPMKISGPAGSPVEPEQLATFRSVRDQLLADLGPGSVALADEAL